MIRNSRLADAVKTPGGVGRKRGRTRGLLPDHHVIRHLCDLEAVSTLEGTESMHILIIGQDITGIPAFD